MTQRTGAQANAAGEWASGGIDTPKGLYVPQTDHLIDEVKAAARYAGLSRFKLFINGAQVNNPNDVPTQSIAELTENARVEGVEGSAAKVEVKRYDRAGYCFSV